MITVLSILTENTVQQGAVVGCLFGIFVSLSMRATGC
jgi:hypothetical protein